MVGCPLLSSSYPHQTYSLFLFCQISYILITHKLQIKLEGYFSYLWIEWGVIHWRSRRQSPDTERGYGHRKKMLSSETMSSNMALAAGAPSLLTPVSQLGYHHMNSPYCHCRQPSMLYILRIIASWKIICFGIIFPLLYGIKCTHKSCKFSSEFFPENS